MQYPRPKLLLRAFTLLEVCLAIFIAVLIVLAAVPSLSGVIEEQRAKRLFNQFDDLVREARSRSVTERRPYALVWDKTGVFLSPLQSLESDETPAAETPGPAPAASAGDSSPAAKRVDFGERQTPELQLPAALNANVPYRWTFWPSGTCEPATIICRLADAPWTATYDPLTVQPGFSSP